MADNRMVSVSQTDEEVKISIELTKVSSSRPVVVVLNNFVKFNCPPVYFESFLWGDVDETESVCRLFKKQARIILRKKETGIWPKILEKVPREVALKKKIELTDLIVERTQKEDKERSEQFDLAKKEKLQHQIDREMSIHDKIKEFNRICIAESMAVSGNKDDSLANKEAANIESNSNHKTEKNEPRKVFKYVPPITNNLRRPGKIAISFSDFKASTPKRESQEALTERTLSNPNVTIY